MFLSNVLWECRLESSMFHTVPILLKSIYIWKKTLEGKKSTFE